MASSRYFIDLLFRAGVGARKVEESCFRTFFGISTKLPTKYFVKLVAMNSLTTNSQQLKAALSYASLVLDNLIVLYFKT